MGDAIVELILSNGGYFWEWKGIVWRAKRV
jgi:hypothetical protein